MSASLSFKDMKKLHAPQTGNGDRIYFVILGIRSQTCHMASWNYGNSKDFDVRKSWLKLCIVQVWQIKHSELCLISIVFLNATH